MPPIPNPSYGDNVPQRRSYGFFGFGGLVLRADGRIGHVWEVNVKMLTLHPIPVSFHICQPKVIRDANYAKNIISVLVIVKNTVKTLVQNLCMILGLELEKERLERNQENIRNVKVAEEV